MLESAPKPVCVTCLAWLVACAAVPLSCSRDRGAKDTDRPEITFWTTEGYHPETVVVLEELAAAFGAKQGVRIRLEFFNWEEINSKYLAALAAGTPPNIGQHGPDLPLRFGREGAVTPVDDIISALGRERFYPEFLDAACKFDGHYWSVPWYIEVRPLLVRRDWLEELDLAPPATWDEWLSMCKAMTRDMDGDGKIDRWGFGLYGKDRFGQAWVALAAQNGGGLFAEDGRITVDSPRNAEALQWYADLFLVHKVSPPGTRSTDWMGANAYYKAGVVGSVLMNGYLLHELRADAPQLLENSIFVPVPAREAGGVSRSYLGGSHLMVFANAPHAQHAADFVRYLLDRENYLRFLSAVPGGPLPVLRDVGESAFFQDDPNRRVLIGQISGSVRHGFRGPPRPAVGAAEGEGVFGKALEEVLSGRMSAAEALRAAQTQTERVFKAQGSAP